MDCDVLADRILDRQDVVELPAGLSMRRQERARVLQSLVNGELRLGGGRERLGG